jgi:hypothetical protein
MSNQPISNQIKSPSLLNAQPFWLNPFEGLNASNEEMMPLSNLAPSPSLDRLLDDFLKPSVVTFEKTQGWVQQDQFSHGGPFSMTMQDQISSSKYGMPSQMMHSLSDKYSGSNNNMSLQIPMLHMNYGAPMYTLQPNYQGNVVSQYPVAGGIRMSDIYVEQPAMISPGPQSPVIKYQPEFKMPISPPFELTRRESFEGSAQQPFELNVLPVRPSMQQEQSTSSSSSGPTFIRQRQQSGSFSSFNHHHSVSDVSTILSRRGSIQSNASSEGSATIIKTPGNGSITKMSQLYALHDLGERKFDCPRCPKKYRNMNGLKYHLIHVHSALEGIPIDVLLADRKREMEGRTFKPFDCPIHGCLKRYKNPNGLKYHLDHAHSAADLVHDGFQKSNIRRPTHSRAVSLSVIDTAQLNKGEESVSPSDLIEGPKSVPEEFLFSPQYDMSQNLFALPLSTDDNGFQI